MSSFNRIVLPVLAVLSLAFLAACGSSSNKATPPPTGGFSNTNLNGTYVFSTQGFDASGSPLTIGGAFTACGCSGGTISGGNLTVVDFAIASPAVEATINASSYAVGVDGRGTATLSTSAASPLNVIKLDFALNSTNGGVVSEFDATGSGSGTIALATTVAQTDIENSTGYAYMVTGDNSSATFATAAVGAFVVSSTGALSGGEYDLSDVNLSNGTVSGFANFTFVAPSGVTVGTGTAPGSASLTDGANTYTFDVYAVSATDLKLVETDGIIVGSGDAFPQATTLPSGTLAFTMNGIDDSDGVPLSMGGLLPFSSGTITAGTQDYNDGGTAATQTSVGGSFTNPLSAGRATLQLTSFFNGGTLVPPNVNFAAYPTTNGTLLVEIDGGGVTAGSALVQTNTSLAASQGYAMDISAQNIGSGTLFEEDDISEFSTTGSGFSGLVDVNDEGNFSSAQTFDGTYSSLSTGRYQFGASSSGNFGGVNGAVYTVDGQTLLFLEGDATQIGTGILQVQNASGAAKAAARVPVKTFHQLAAHAAKWHKK